MKNTWKKLIVSIFAFAMVLTGINLLSVQGSKVQAAGTETSVKYYVQPYTGEQVSSYKSTNVAPVPTPEQGQEKYNDWLFAGWFTDATCSKALDGEIDTATTYYAKYVPSEVLSVKVQVTKDTDNESPNADMRLISTVDSLQYENVGFEVYYNGSTKAVKVNATTVYRRIEAGKGGVDYGFSPNIFDVQSKYFITATLKNIVNKNFANGFYIRPYWETLDGTMVYGVSRYARVEDSYLNIVNVPVRLVSDSATATTGTVNVTYDTEKFTYLNEYKSTLASGKETSTPGLVNGSIFGEVKKEEESTPGTVTITGPADATEAKKINGEIAHLRFQAKDIATLPKKNEFKVSSEDLKDNIVAVDSVYNHFRIAAAYNDDLGADATWYDPSETEFVITTAEELYGLASKVNATENPVTFAGKTIYLGSDIRVNSGTPAGANGVAGDDDDWSKVAPTNVWSAIGKNADANAFGGIFDGQNHAIRGLYNEAKTNSQIGLFGYATNATIQNLKVADSYFVAKYRSAVVCGQAMNTSFENIYTNAYLYVDGVSGGIVGYSEGGNIKKCWADNKIDINDQGKYGFVGGLAGQLTGADINISDCLISGSVKHAGNTGGFVGIIQNTTTIKNCLNVATVSGTSNVGGAVGNVSSVLKTENVYVYKSGTTNPVGKSSGNIQSVSGTTLTISNAATCFEDKTAYYGKAAVDGLSGLAYNTTWVIRQSNTPALTNWVTSGALYAPDTDWAGSGKKNDPWIIKSAAELYGLADSVNEGESYEGKYFELGADITVNSGTASRWEIEAPKYTWIPIGTADKDGNVKNPFKGHFNSAGDVHQIKGLYAVGSASESTKEHVGLFGILDDAEVKNIKILNSYFKGNKYVGVVGSATSANIDTVYSDAILNVDISQGGGIVGHIYGGAINNCWYDGSITATGRYLGGIVGIEQGLDSITNCLMTGSISCTSTSGNVYTGGILGLARSDVRINDCVVAAKDVQSVNTGCYGSVIGSINDGGDYGTYVTTVEHVYVADTIGNTPNTVGRRANSNGTLSGEPIVSTLVSYKGGNGYMLSLDFDTYWSPIENEVPALQAFVKDADAVVDVYAWHNGSADGSGENPYIIDEAYELYAMAELVNNGTDSFKDKYIVLKSELTFNTNTDYANLAHEPAFNWIPIGTLENPFKGNFNALDNSKIYTISGLYTNVSTENVGLFGYTENATVKNIKLIDSSFTGSKYVGAVVGYNRLSTVDTVSVEADVTSKTGGRVGGIIGRLEGGIVNNCMFDGSVTLVAAEQYTGGLVGQVGWLSSKPTAPTISNSFAKGTVTSGRKDGNAYVGGVLGGASSLNVTIEGCFSATESVKTAGATGCVGDFVGGNASAAVTTINSYVVTDGTVNGTGAAGGSYVGEAYKVADSTGASLYMARLDFDTYWVVKEATPELKSFATNAAMFDARSWYDDAEAIVIDGESYAPGTKQNPYIIDEAYELYNLAEIVNADEDRFSEKYIVLGDDIVYNSGDSSKWSTSAPAYDFVPIGVDTAIGFKGHLNDIGEIKEIKGLYINKGTSNFGGLFGSAIGATIANIKVSNGYVQGGQHIGTVVGYAKNTTIDTVYSNVYVKATIATGSANAGGIVGYQDKGTTSKCWAAGTVEGTGDTQYVGGVVGRITDNNGAVINNCLATGKVISGRTTKTSNNAYVGGILGGATATVTMSDCFSAVTQVSTAGATGCVGSVLGGTTVTGVTITNCYATKESCNGVSLGTGGAGTPSGTPTVMEKYVAYHSYQNTTLDFDDIWVAMEKGAPNLQAFAPKSGRFDTTSWYVKDGADGTAEKPYIIDTVAEMYGLAKLVNAGNTFEGKYIKLDADLTFNRDTDYTKEGYVAEYEWTPIGVRSTDGDSNARAFKGSFNVDGDMHEIRGLYSKLSQESVGLFGYIHSASIQNIKVVDSYLEGTKYVATIAGYSRDSEIDSVYANATVIATTSGRAGGIAGRLKGGTINRCWSDCDVSVPAATQYAGGIVGQVGLYNMPKKDSVISNCLAEGTVYIGNKEGNAYAGGILGGASSLNVTITNCLSAVDSVTTAGTTGCVGSFVGGSSNTVVTTTDSYVIQGISSKVNGTGGSGSYTGEATSIVKEAFYDTEAYEYFDSYVWAARVGEVPIPAVFAQADYTVPAKVGSTYAVDTVLEGSGTEQDPYQISTAAELYGFAILSQAKENAYAGEYVELTADIAVNPTKINKDDAEAVYYDWYPIGNTKKPFAGTFIGNGHTISGLYKVWDKYDQYIGLFAETAGTSYVKDFYITNTRFQYDTIKDATRIGSVAGRGYGTFDSIYSEASLSSGGYGTGGIVGAVESTANTTITNCWYKGDITLLVDKTLDENGKPKQISTFAGGIVGYVAGGNLTIKHSLFSGSIITEGRRIGGLVGSVHNTSDVASTFVSTDNLITGKIIGNGAETGIIAGRVYSNNESAPCQATINNTFGVGDYASYDVQDITGSTVTGSAYVSNSKDRFIGFMGESATLDFAGSTKENGEGFTGWVLMETKAPMLKSFVDAGKIDFGTKNTAITSVDDVKKIIDPTSSYNFGAPAQKGAGEYLFTTTGKTSTDFKNYCATLTAFTKVSSNTIENVLNNVYTSGDYTLNVTFANGTIYVTFSTSQTLSEHLNDENGNKATVDYTQKEGFKTDGYTAASGEIPEVKFHMVEQEYYQANCFIIQLTNGHFIVIDGGMPKHSSIAPAEFFYEYLEKLVPAGKTPIVEAWVVSHAHEDHIGIFETIYGDAIATAETTKNYAGRIYVEGIYFNEPNDAVITTYAEGHHRLIANLKFATTKLKTSAGKEPKVYSMLTGQRYTFDTVMMDVLEAQEVLSQYSSGGDSEAFNDTSTWTMFTINGKKVLTAGDSSDYGMQFINNTYSKDFLTVDVFTALHHGLNTGRYTSGSNLTNNLTVTGVLLYTNQYDMTNQSGGHPEAGYLVFNRNAALVGKSALKGISVDGTIKKYLYYGQGTSVLTFGKTITATLLPNNDWDLTN